MTDEDIVEEIARLEKLLQEAKRMAGVADNHSNATINVNAGGVGVFVCCGLVAFLAGMSIPLYFEQRDQQRQIDDMTHYLNAIYQQAPNLKPKEN